MSTTVRGASPFLEKLVKEGIYSDMDEAVKEFKLMRERTLGTHQKTHQKIEEEREMVKESERQLILELEEYKKLVEDYLGVMREWYERAVSKESDIDILLGKIGEQEINMRGLSYRVFGYDRGDARKYINNIEGIIAILKGEEWD